MADHIINGVSVGIDVQGMTESDRYDLEDKIAARLASVDAATLMAMHDNDAACDAVEAATAECLRAATANWADPNGAHAYVFLAQ